MKSINLINVGRVTMFKMCIYCVNVNDYIYTHDYLHLG